MPQTFAHASLGRNREPIYTQCVFSAEVNLFPPTKFFSWLSSLALRVLFWLGSTLLAEGSINSRTMLFPVRALWNTLTAWGERENPSGTRPPPTTEPVFQQEKIELWVYMMSK